MLRLLRRIFGSTQLLLGLHLIFLAGCGKVDHNGAALHAAAEGITKPFEGEYPIQVVCTTGQIADMLRELGGDHLEVNVLMGPGVDPHLYRAVPSDIEKLDQADAIFYNGLHLEGRMADLFERLGKKKPVFAVSYPLVSAADPRLRKPPEFEGHYDPHLWHDAMLWADCVEYVTTILQKIDPPNADEYASNNESYQSDLQKLDTYCRDQLATIPHDQRALVTAHDAFGYFCKAYDLESMPLKGISTDDEVAIGRMDEVIDYLVRRKVKAVFVESAVAPKIVEALIEPCKAAGHEVHVGGELYADALGLEGSGAETYIGMIRTNVDTIVAALSGE